MMYQNIGTALYKALKSIRRFSEDIDLTICIDSCSGSQAKKEVLQQSMITRLQYRWIRMILFKGLVMSKWKELRLL